MKIADIRGKTVDQLNDDLASLRKEQFNLRFQRATGQNEGLGRVKQARREIARIKTVQSQNKRAAAKTAAQPQS